MKFHEGDTKNTKIVTDKKRPQDKLARFSTSCSQSWKKLP
jgi:hypothetical protein